jgi:hypothetical protein
MIERLTELLFPPRLIPDLGGLRGEGWQELVGQVLKSEALSPLRTGFVLLMVSLAGCQSCHMNTFRAQNGCAACARNSLLRFRGSDSDLWQRFTAACREVDSTGGRG